MKKLFTLLVAVSFVFCFVSFSAAQDNDPLEEVQTYEEGFQWTPGGLPWQLFIPHYDIGNTWWTGLCIMNNSINANQCTVWYCDNDGYTKGWKDYAFTAFQKQAFMLTPTMTGGCKTGWIVIESQFPMIGFVNFGNVDSATTLGPFFSN